MLTFNTFEKICSYLSLCDISNLSLVNKQFNRWIKKTNYKLHNCDLLETNTEKVIAGCIKIKYTLFENACALLRVAAEYGNLRMYKFLISNSGTAFDFESISYAALNGHLNICEFVFNNSQYVNDSKSFYEIYCIDALCNSAQGGYLDVFKLIDSKIFITKDDLELSFNIAARYGNLNICKWLYKYRPHNYNYYHAFVCAAEFSYLNVCKWLKQVDPTINVCEEEIEAFEYAIVNGELEFCKWLKEIEPAINITDEYFAIAAANGRLKICKWLLKQNKFINIRANNDEAFIIAAEEGHLSVCKWLKKIEPAVNINEAFKKAAIFNHEEICIWLLSYGIKLKIVETYAPHFI